MGLPASAERDDVHGRRRHQSSRFILHDRDTKFSEEFDEAFRDDGTETVKTPFQAPDANAFAESWIGNFKREVLNHFMCFGLKHLDHIAQQGVEFYNTHRPHQSKANEPLRFPGEELPPNPSAKQAVECETHVRRSSEALSSKSCINQGFHEMPRYFGPGLVDQAREHPKQSREGRKFVIRRRASRHNHATPNEIIQSSG